MSFQLTTPNTSAAAHTDAVWEIKTTGFTAVAAGKYLIQLPDATNVDVELPGAPSIGDAVTLVQNRTSGGWGVVTVERNGELIDSAANDYQITALATDQGVQLVFAGGAIGWKTLPFQVDMTLGGLIDVSSMAGVTGQILQKGTFLWAPAYLPCEIGVAVSDETSNLTTGTANVTFRMPYAMTVTAVRASVNTAPTGSTIVVDINEGGTSILSTKLSIDVSEKTSTTAATAPVISDSALADDAEITIDIDQIGSTVAGAGLKIWLIGTRA